MPVLNRNQAPGIEAKNVKELLNRLRVISPKPAVKSKIAVNSNAQQAQNAIPDRLPTAPVRGHSIGHYQIQVF